MTTAKFETNLLHCYWTQLLRNLSNFLKKILWEKHQTVYIYKLATEKTIV